MCCSSSLRQQTLDLDTRADQMERMIKQLLSEQESLREEIKRLRGEQEVGRFEFAQSSV